MSARGARSRKVAEKNIEKLEKKAAVKQKAPVQTIRKPTDAFGTNPPPGHPLRQLTISSDVSRATSTSRTSSTSGSNARPLFHSVNSQDSEPKRMGRPRTSTSASNSISDAGSGSKGNEKNKYAAKGNKETKAPRGRGGGVPVKKAIEPPAPPLFRAETSLAYPTTNSKTWMNFRIWDGSNQGVKPYGGFDFDEHMQSGTVLIYFKEEQVNEDRPVPQLRAEFEVLENCGSTWINNALLYGRLEDADIEDEEWMYEARRQSSLSPQSVSPNFPRPPGGRMLGPTSPSGLSSPPSLHIDQQYWGVPGAGSASRADYYTDMDPSSVNSPLSYQRTSQQHPTHELWFTAPESLKTPQAQRLHFVAVRNFLAMLHGKPLVGADMFEMLTTLHAEIQVMYDLDHDNNTRMSSSERSVQMIINYLIKYKLDDVRQSIKQALCLLAWAEQDNVKWKQGYLECFVHLTGVLSPQLEEVPEFKRLSLVTRRNLGIAAKQLQLRIMDAEEKLGPFEFDDVWFDPAKSGTHPVFQSYQAFKQFLVNYYTGIYGNWPPMQGKSWLNRKIALDLQHDFGALYDYLVNRDVVWDSREERPGKKWQMVNPKSEDFRADRPDLSVTDMIVTFDNKHGYLHIPHPYALLPRDIPQGKAAPVKKSLFGLKKSKPEATKDAKAHLQLSIIYSDATNIEKLDDSFKGSPLIDAYETFELSTPLKPNTTPREARVGRWLLLYPILQYLSTISVDSLTLKYTAGVRYFLNADLKRLPEWVTNGQAVVESSEDMQRRSWCWNRGWSGERANIKPGAPVELDGEGVERPQQFDNGEMERNAETMNMPMHQQMQMQMQGNSMHGGDSMEGGGPIDPSARRNSRTQMHMLNPVSLIPPPPSPHPPSSPLPPPPSAQQQQQQQQQRDQQQQQQLPQYTSSSDPNIALQNDIRRINEKIDSIGLQHQQQQQHYHSQHFQQRRPTRDHDLDKLKGHHDDYDYSPTHTPAPQQPQQHGNHAPGERIDTSYRLTASDYASPIDHEDDYAIQRELERELQSEREQQHPGGYSSPPPPFTSNPASPASHRERHMRGDREVGMGSGSGDSTPKIPSRSPLRPPSGSYISARGGYERYDGPGESTQQPLQPGFQGGGGTYHHHHHHQYQHHDRDLDPGVATSPSSAVGPSANFPQRIQSRNLPPMGMALPMGTSGGGGGGGGLSGIHSRLQHHHGHSQQRGVAGGPAGGNVAAGPLPPGARPGGRMGYSAGVKGAGGVWRG
ncbi:hypothetical protein DM02DRAFT_668700 [Periconia macrospinosa]|uniref:DUF8004 domain-containing protein n=1 Tax=Periconia macrospinosa TaxID=97972 RepID=A0A2V1E370_9PLEO|nr:hypothetical protein DM02DRAFT_668700 [Periconia macrospinosa]